MSEQGSGPRQQDPWRTLRVMRLYASGEAIPQIARSVGWSEGRVRKVLREAGIALTEEATQLARRNSEEARRRLLEAGWEATLRGGRLVWRRPGEWASWCWCSQEVAIALLEMLEEEKDGKDGSP